MEEVAAEVEVVAEVEVLGEVEVAEVAVALSNVLWIIYMLIKELEQFLLFFESKVLDIVKELLLL